MLKFYEKSEKMQTLSAQLSWSHYCELIPLENIQKIKYYIKIIEEQNLSVRELRNKIKSKEYERLDDKTKELLIQNIDNSTIESFIKEPIVIKNSSNKNEITEKVLKTTNT